MEIVRPEEKKIVCSDDDKKRQDASVENSLIKKVKMKNEFEGRKKNRKRLKKSYAQRVKERISEYYEEKPLKIHAKRKKINMTKFQMSLKKKNN